MTDDASDEMLPTPEGALLMECAALECTQYEAVIEDVTMPRHPELCVIVPRGGPEIMVARTASRYDIADALTSDGAVLRKPFSGQVHEPDDVCLEDRADRTWCEVLYTVGQYSWHLLEFTPRLRLARLRRVNGAAIATVENTDHRLDFALDITRVIDPMDWIFDIVYDFATMTSERRP